MACDHGRTNRSPPPLRSRLAARAFLRDASSMKEAAPRGPPVTPPRNRACMPCMSTSPFPGNAGSSSPRGFEDPEPSIQGLKVIPGLKARGSKSNMLAFAVGIAIEDTTITTTIATARCNSQNPATEAMNGRRRSRRPPGIHQVATVSPRKSLTRRIKNCRDRWAGRPGLRPMPPSSPSGAVASAAAAAGPRSPPERRDPRAPEPRDPSPRPRSCRRRRSTARCSSDRAGFPPRCGLSD